MENIIWVVLLCAVLALLFAAWKTSAVSKADAGTERMKEIAGNISDGARAFLFAEYKILVIFVAVLFVLIGLFITWLTAGCFLIGAVFSVCAGYVGMNVATKANVRTAAAAKSSGMNKALGVAFSGGSVMGMCVVGLGLLGCAAIYAFTGNVEILTGFSLGASSIALFARVGGGIYTKAADVGADLVGKVEAGIPEDDPRNPAVIADNVGDNVGDVAGMGADLFESYVGALVSALTLGVAVVGTFNGAGALFPLILAATGIIASIIGCFFVRGDENSNPHKALKMGSYVSSAIVVVLSLVLSNVFFGGMAQAIAIIAGLIVGLIIGIVTEIYPSGDYNSVKKIAQQSETGPATTIISGIAVGMASQICGFNLGEVCDTTIAYLKNPAHDIASTLLAPDFPTGGQIICDGDDLRVIYSTGRGGLKVRARWRYDKKENVVEVYEIPYSTTIEAILDKVAELVKAGKVKEIADMRDETDLSGLKLAIDLKRGVDPDKLMAKLYRLTPLQDTVSCNFNILIAGMPRVLGVGGILEEWTAWRTDCVKRRVYFILNKKKEKLHLLQGLKRILLDIDRAIRIIRETEEEAEVIPNLMIGFGIDQVQAEYVAEIKLRNINKEYILKRVAETSALQDEIEDLEDTLAKPGRIRKIIIGELEDVKKKYAVPRRTEIVYSHEMPEEPDEEPVEDYPVHLFLSREGYFKKITPQSLRMSGEQKFKEGDSLRQYFEAANSTELLLFTDKCQVYKSRASEFGETKASALGDYLPAKLGMDAGENVIWLCLPGDYSGSVVFFFENGRAARVALSAYATVSNRRKLTGAYCDKFPLVCAVHLTEDTELALETNEPRALLVHTALLSPKTTRSTQGVQVMSIKPKYRLEKVLPAAECGIVNGARYRTRTIPAAGALLKPEDSEEKQLELL